MPPLLSRGRPLGLALSLALVCSLATAEEPPRKALRVCKDPNNMPFTNAKGEGFEDRIAALFAAQLGLPVETYAFPQRLGFIRNTLRYKLPGADYPCDLVMGVPAGFEQVLPTKAYYRSTYVLVFPASKGLAAVKSEADFLALPPEQLAALKIGVFDRSPGSAWLARHQLVDAGVPYRLMSANPDAYPGEMIERDLAQGVIDVALVWGPIGGHFARQAKGTELRVVPLASAPGVQFDFAVAMGVRFGEKAWKQQIETLIDRNRDQIDAILSEYGVPVLAEPAGAAGGRRDALGAACGGNPLNDPQERNTMSQPTMRRPYLNVLRPAALLLAVGLALAAPGTRAGQEISAAEQRMFVDPHLDNMPAAATLHYAYRKTEAGRPPVDDEVILSTRQDGSRGRVVQVDYLHGARHLDLPEVAQARANPVILYFLEHDVRGMHQRLGGKENYFRRRIRLALAEATLQPITIEYAGQRLAATQVVVRPFADDPLAGRLQGADRKTYQFTLSDQVPSGVYELRTMVADPAGAATPLVEESLTLRPGVDPASFEKRKTL